MQLRGARVAAVPDLVGAGLHPRLLRVRRDAILAPPRLRRLGDDAARRARHPGGSAPPAPTLVFLADDHRFIALNLTQGLLRGRRPGDRRRLRDRARRGGARARRPPRPAARARARGPRRRAPARQSRGARSWSSSPTRSASRRRSTVGLEIEPVDLAEGLARCDLIFDATPAAGIIDAGDVRPETIAAVPGLPSAFTAAAQEALGARHIHEPLAIGVAVMAARALL